MKTMRRLPHLLPADPRSTGRTRPAVWRARHATRFTETPDAYTGPAPIVTHVHSAVRVGDESDGYAESWYLPDAGDPVGLRDRGTWFDVFAAKAAASFGARWGRGHATWYPHEFV